jgi:hypothetical protein
MKTAPRFDFSLFFPYLFIEKIEDFIESIFSFVDVNLYAFLFLLKKRIANMHSDDHTTSLDYRPQVCTLELSNLPPFDPSLFSAFKHLTLVRGRLVISNNKYLYNLDFLSNLYLVCMPVCIESQAQRSSGRCSRNQR